MEIQVNILIYIFNIEIVGWIFPDCDIRFHGVIGSDENCHNRTENASWFFCRKWI